MPKEVFSGEELVIVFAEEEILIDNVLFDNIQRNRTLH